ncbi:deoxyribose-phosphate aldolase, putative [Pediculus humanus corporis]|uniref:deoxyribose-phosphate aldolase n=1 Tax=Pediculus humanus subsp. corporis TaxID=121224 RepID=E0W355_PEDHC|nr:deoxyribose-phosphate aldolase, putative [Pediculus humanus corporis]EEB20061.1 deoxyribose-phosphate aldolase, putative [Pediculus humanus corporis]
MDNNLGWDLDLGWINSVSINAWCLYDSERDAWEECYKLNGIYKAAWLLKAVSCLDLTTLSGDDTWSNVNRLTIKAVNPIPSKILSALEFPQKTFTTAAVCVYPSRVTDAVSTLKKLSLVEEFPVAAVSTGFPTGQFCLDSRLLQIEDCLKNGASEIDVVIDRSLVLTNEWELLYKELKLMKEKCGSAKMKTILAVGELGNFRNVYKASLVAMMAGSDFIKTSTGKETINATFPLGTVMMRAIREYYTKTNYKVGFKAAGGIKTSNDALNWLALAKKELGVKWLDKSLFRIGASGLLQDIEKELYCLTFNMVPSLNEFTLP